MRAKKAPRYCLHRASGQAVVRIGGRDHYLGRHGTPESRARYDQLILEWHTGDVGRFAMTIDSLCLAYVEHADEYYRRPDGTPTGAARNIREALRYLVRLHGPTPVREFGPLKLKTTRDAMIQAGLCRTNINRQMQRIKTLFRWGVECEFVPPTVYQALAAVASLKRGRTAAVESAPIQPVDEGTITATLPHLPAVIANMVSLQLLTGARPGEVCRLRPCDITMGTDGVWCYRPERHKTEHHGRERRIFIGPAGQSILRRYMDRDPEACCFTPADSEAERNASRRRERKSKLTPSQKARQPKQDRARAPRDHFTKDSFARAVQRACERAFGMPAELRRIASNLSVEQIAEQRRRAQEWRRLNCWSPNQLRHSRATIIRERYGIEAAQTVLGHSDPRTTEIYAERDFQLAARIMREIG